jgi:sterol desaturase/sphingolipid hydroxylase (fatty acid hydroxylase superfamily)
MHDLFEPFIAVSSFFVWIHSFYFAEKNLPGMIQYRLSKNTTVSTTNDNSLSPWYSNWLFRELPLYLGPLYFLSIHFDAFKFRRMALSQSAPSIFRILREILGGLFLYDFFFFFTHFPLHNLGKTVYKHMHARHHSNKEVRAVDTIKLSTVEEFIDVACSIIGLRILNAHPISRTLYNIVITGLLAELHCGYDLPLSPQNIVPFGLWAGSKRHHIHHRNGNVYFQKFFTYLDNGFGLVEKEKVLKY